MPTNADILWFKTTYGARLLPYIKDTPFTLDMMTALACQETGEVWPFLRKVKALSPDDILALCVGDTLDRDSTFPKDKDHLLSVPKGQEMLDIARQALVDMAVYVKSYQGAAKNKKKFCKGFGLFQYDLQFFKTKEKDFFLNKLWATLDGTTTHALGELNNALKTLGLQGATSLTDEQFAFAGIVYNTGRFIKSKGLDQGFVTDGKHYGRNLFEFIAKCRAVKWTPPDPQAEGETLSLVPAAATSGMAMAAAKAPKSIVMAAAASQAEVFAFASSWDALLRDLLHPNGHPEPTEADDELDQLPFAKAVIEKTYNANPGADILIGFDVNAIESTDLDVAKAFGALSNSVVAAGHQRSIYLEGPFGETANNFDPGEARRLVAAADTAGLAPSKALKAAKDPSKTAGFKELRAKWIANRVWWEKFVSGQLQDYKAKGYAAAEIDNLGQIFDPLSDEKPNPNASGFERPVFGNLHGILAFFRTFADEFVAGRVPPLILKNIDAATLIDIKKHLLSRGAPDDRTKLPREMFADFHICEINAGTKSNKANKAIVTASADIGIETVFSEHTEHYRAHGTLSASTLLGLGSLPLVASSLSIATPMAPISEAARLAALAAGFTQRLVDIAISEWAFFGKQEYDLSGNLKVGGHKEGENGFYQRIADYWLTGTDTHGVDGRDHGWYWSAAFISWCEKKAGADKKFRYSTQHSVYISQSIRDHKNNRVDSGYWGWRLNEVKPSVGDLVCWARKNGIDYDHQNQGDYPGHTDIIVEVTPKQIVVIGGNVGDSVTRRPLALDDGGFIKPVVQHGETLFGLMKCRIV